MWLTTGKEKNPEIRYTTIHEKDYSDEDYFRIAEELRKEGVQFSASMLDSAVHAPIRTGRGLLYRKDERRGDWVSLDINRTWGEMDGKSEEEIQHEEKFVLKAVELKNRILDTISDRSLNADVLLDELEEFAKENRRCEGVTREYERAILGICGGLFREENIYYDEVEQQRDRYLRLRKEFPKYYGEGPEGIILLLNGLAHSRIIARRDGTCRTPSEAREVYQEIFDGLQSDSEQIHDGYLSILYGISRDSSVYSDEEAVSLYQHFEDLVFGLMHQMCSEMGVMEFGRRHLVNLAATIEGCYFLPWKPGWGMIETDDSGSERILGFLSHFIDRLYAEFTMVVDDSYIDPLSLGESIKNYGKQSFGDLLSPDKPKEPKTVYKKTNVGVYLYDPRSKGEKYIPE